MITSSMWSGTGTSCHKRYPHHASVVKSFFCVSILRRSRVDTHLPCTYVSSPSRGLPRQHGSECFHNGNVAVRISPSRCLSIFSVFAAIVRRFNLLHLIFSSPHSWSGCHSQDLGLAVAFFCHPGHAPKPVKRC